MAATIMYTLRGNEWVSPGRVAIPKEDPGLLPDTNLFPNTDLYPEG